MMVFPVLQQINNSGREFLFFNCNVEDRKGKRQTQTMRPPPKMRALERPAPRAAAKPPAPPALKPASFPASRPVNLQRQREVVTIDPTKTTVVILGDRTIIFEPKTNKPVQKRVQQVTPKRVFRSIFWRMKREGYLANRIGKFCSLQPARILNPLGRDLFFDYTKRMYNNLGPILFDQKTLKSKLDSCYRLVRDQTEPRKGGLRQEKNHRFLSSMVDEFCYPMIKVVVNENGRENPFLTRSHLLREYGLLSLFIREALSVSFQIGNAGLQRNLSGLSQRLGMCAKNSLTILDQNRFGMFLHFERVASAAVEGRNSIYGLAKRDATPSSALKGWSILLRNALSSQKLISGLQFRRFFPLPLYFYNEIRTSCNEARRIIEQRYGLNTLAACPAPVKVSK